MRPRRRAVTALTAGPTRATGHAFDYHRPVRKAEITQHVCAVGDEPRHIVLRDWFEGSDPHCAGRQRPDGDDTPSNEGHRPKYAVCGDH
jgi:hypothetical protein